MHDVDPAMERWRAALDRRDDDLRQRRKRVQAATSLREEIDLQREFERDAPLQTTANMGFSHMKRRR